MEISPDVRDEVQELLAENRVQCAWFLRRDFVPATLRELRASLHAVARRGDRATYQRAMQLLQRLPELHN